MDERLSAAISGLMALGWRIDVQERPDWSLPEAITQRYGRVPAQLEEFLTFVQRCVSSSDTAWLLCLGNYAGTSGCAFAWNAFETMGLEDSVDGLELLAENEPYWSAHLTVGQAVGSHYTYLALRLNDGAVVFGEEPEFEQSTVVAGSFYELLEMLSGQREAHSYLQWFK